jgi:glycosyltransferase involved in cell wall biosynthesis
LNNSKDINNRSRFVCAVIPFYNEKETLDFILNETLKYVQCIIAVNDGSKDEDYSDKKLENVIFINLDKNYGKGKALSAGFETVNNESYDVVVTLDADLQHDPSYIPSLVESTDYFDVVIGNRLNDLKKMPMQRRLSNKLTSFFLTLKTRQKIIDSQCGFRAYRSEVLKNVKTTFRGFEAESEILVKAAQQGYKIGFVNIPTIYGNEKSKMRSFQAIYGFLRVFFSATKK